MGLIDVKNTWVEPPELVAERFGQVLNHVDARRVSVTPDCGFSQTARHIAIAKARAMVEGVNLVRTKSSIDDRASAPGKRADCRDRSDEAGTGTLALWWLGQAVFSSSRARACWPSTFISPST